MKSVALWLGPGSPLAAKRSKRLWDQAQAETAGTDKSRLLTAMIWLKNIDEDFAAMNGVWNAWVDPDNKPVRACVEANMARPSILVEIQCTAAAAE